MKVREAMTRDVQLVKPEQPISEAAKLMAKLDIGALPVEENDRLVGMITDRDIAVRAVAAGRGPDTPIRDVMSRAGVSLITGTSKVNAVPRPTLDSTLALTSWGRIDKLDEFDRDRILSFIRAFRDNAPENGAP